MWICSLLLYAADTWILLSADVRTLDAFRQKCLRQLLGIRLYDRVQNNEVLQRISGPVWLHCLISYPVDASRYLGMWLDFTTTHRQTWLFSSTVHINLSLNRPPDHTWRRPYAPGRPRNKWLEQLQNDSTRRAYDWRPLETSCRPWTWWCNDATALACYANSMIINLFNVTSQLHYRGGPNLHAIENADHGNRCRLRLPRELDRPLEFITIR